MFAIFAVVVFLIVGGLIYYLRPASSCFDNRQNQDEEGVDCGGSCAPCSERIKDLVILWNRFFFIREGVVDVAALLENGNQFLQTKDFQYAVKVYDENNILIAVKEGRTFIHPGEKFLVFEPNIATINRVPRLAVLELRGVKWESGEYVPLKIDISKKEILLKDSIAPRVEFALKNQANKKYSNIEAAVVVLGEGDIVLGASKTILDRLDIAEERAVIMTWPMRLDGAQKAEIFLRQIP